MAKPLPMPYEEFRDYIRKWAGIRSVKQMISEINVSSSCLLAHAQEMGLSLELKGKVEQREMIIQAVREYHDKLNGSAIAKKLNVYPSSVYYAASQLGIELKREVRTQKEPAMGTNFFDESARSNWLI